MAVEDAILTNPDREVTVSANGDLRGSWDRDRGLQAVGNLLANALRYGQREVAVTAAVIQLTNHGEPIAEDRIARLFEPFQQSEAGASKREGLSLGQGLGLDIVSEIMRAHGGSVAVSSSSERGTTFTLIWPRSESRPFN